MFSATVTDTGQITLPQEIRDRLKLVNGSKISFIIIVLCELVWVLRGADYGFSKDEIIHTLEAMLRSL